jgi:hypothetical protein
MSLCTATLGLPRTITTAAVLLFVFLTTAEASAAEAPEPENDAEVADAFQKYAKETAAQYDIRLGSPAGRKLVLHEASLLRWTNPLAGAKAHGEVFVWTDRGRPEAVLSLYQFTTANVVHEHHELSSLALAGLVAVRSRQPVWSPRVAGTELRVFSEASDPQSSPRLRLNQMRRLAGEFRIEKTTRDDVKRELRLLPNPVYRYESEDPEVLDGALFAFVEVTDPEAFVMIEAWAEGKEKYEWQCAFARMDSCRLRVYRADQLLWEAPELPWRDTFDRTENAYTALQIR